MIEYIGTTKKQSSIVEVLKEEILSGRTSGGTELTQNELAEALGVSRMPVREALIVLEYQGLMERLPNNHVRVVTFAKDYFDRIFRLCEELEEEGLEGYRTSQPKAEATFTVADELAFHRQLCSSMSHSFLRKTLETMIEIYVAFAVRQGRTGASDRCELLTNAVNGTAQPYLHQYFTELSKVIDCVRK